MASDSPHLVIESKRNHMLYQMLLVIFQFALKQYFKHINVYFEESLPADRPVLFVANHQSAFMDAIVVGTQIDRQLNFVSRGESFDKAWKRWILSKFNMHPIYRKEFTPDLTKKNPEAIQSFQNLLVNGKSILIFPEGISQTSPRLSEIKTGAARIALGAAHMGDQAPLLVPIGINYTNPHQFRSEVTVNFGTPIDVSMYQKAFAENERATVQALTDEVTNELERLTLDIPEIELEYVVNSVKSIYEEELLKEDFICQKDQRRVFNVRKELIAAAQYFNFYAPFRLKHLTLHVEHYRKMLLNYGVEDSWLRPNKNEERHFMASNVIFLVMTFPIFLFGFVNHGIALFLSKKLTNISASRPDFKGSLLLSFGVLFCIICYAVQTMGVYYFVGAWETSLLYLISLPLIGKFSLVYLDFYKNVRAEWKRHYFCESGEDVIEHLQKERMRLIELLNGVRSDYLATH